MKHLLLAFALLAAPAAARAQAAQPVTYEFLTVAEIESQDRATAKLVFAPAFQGKPELPLESLPAMSNRYSIVYHHNLAMVNRQLEAVTAEGWELLHVSFNPTTSGHEYLFRRPKP